MNSIRTTYLPRGNPERMNLPSEFVADAYFFPVSVLAAVTVTPGRSVLPLRAEPVISNVVGARAATWGEGAGGVEDCVGEAGGVSCALESNGNRSAAKLKTRMLQRMNFNFRTPW